MGVPVAMASTTFWNTRIRPAVNTMAESGLALKRSQKDTLEKDPEDAGRHDRDDDRRVEAQAELVGEVVDDVGADHVHLAVSKLNDVHDAQDEGQPKGYQNVDTG